ncbi:helix-turn-helix domain-containing protein [Kitasatospora cineracea]|uniref:helix-turn-helix domain-containing protein n=1 Tax=Kitasatospora cineracea TaxID=88074 RepID=UPI0038007CF0
MIVGDLLTLEDLHIQPAWTTPALLAREVTGVTSTDLPDPARYLRAGELVLTGLVWWRPDAADAALRFANSLRSAGAAALLAGEGTHGTVPPELADACRTHGVPLLSVPAGTSFRSVTDRVYLRLWGGLRARAEGAAALPAAVRADLARAVAADAPLADVLARAVTSLGLPDCSLRTAAGRTVAASGPGRPAADGAALPVGPPGHTPFDGWLLQPHESPRPAASALLRGLAEVLAPSAVRARAVAAARRRAAAGLLKLCELPDGAGADAALAACGLPGGQPLTATVARIGGEPEAWAAAALAEALHGAGGPFAAAPDGRGGAVGFAAAPAEEVLRALREAAPRLERRLPAGRSFRAGVGPAARPRGRELASALVQARYALDSRGAAQAVGGSDEVRSVDALLRGVPAEVRAAFRGRLLGALDAHDRENAVSLVRTLEVFLHHDASWARTAQALHVHVNTVHYRIKRIEDLTGRRLTRLQDRLDLRTALLCTPDREE